MASRLYQHLLETYEPRRERSVLNGSGPAPIQVDDQNDGDNITHFCTVFVTVGRKDRMLVEVEGHFPISPELAAFAGQHGGNVDQKAGRLTVQVLPGQTGVLVELAERIRATSGEGATVGNPEWSTIAGRTAGSIERLVSAVLAFLNPVAAVTADTGAMARNHS